MIYKRPEVVSISPHMQHEVFQITETHPDLFIRLLKAPATSIAMFKITTCSGALTVGEHSHIFLPPSTWNPGKRPSTPMPVLLASILRPSSTESAISKLHWTGPSSNPFPSRAQRRARERRTSCSLTKSTKPFHPLITVSGTQAEAAETQAAAQVGEPVPAGGQTQAAGAQSPAGAQGS